MTSDPRNNPAESGDIDALLLEANHRLAKLPAVAHRHPRPSVTDLPLFLLTGAEGSGKTSAFMAAGLAPAYLAGTAAPGAPAAPTRLCNLWLAKDAVVAEPAGWFFSETPARWVSLLRALRSRGKTSNLRGVILCCDVESFLGPPDATRLAAVASRVLAHFGGIADTFGRDFPVCVVFTKCDRIPYFTDYFGRLSEAEERQALGFTVDADLAGPAAELYSDAQSRLLSARFNELYYSLSEKRLETLARETDPARKSLIYEFPRELKRVRGVLVEFLVDAFRPRNGRAGPVLRGVYFTGMRSAPAPQPASDVTRLLRPNDFDPVPPAPEMVSRCTFVAELFGHLFTPGPEPAPLPASRAGRCFALGAAAVLALVLIVLFARSFVLNRELLSEVRAAVRAPAGTLEELERLRASLALLNAHQESGPPWSMRGGFYRAGDLLPTLRQAYFDRFRTLLLDGQERALASSLGAPSSGYDAVYAELKAYQIMAGSCAPQEHFIGSFLGDAWRASNAFDPGAERLARKQFEFYAAELSAGRVPLRVAAEAGLVRRARAHLERFGAAERAYRAIIEAASRQVRPARLADWAPQYADLLPAPVDVDSAFTREGWRFVQDRIWGSDHIVPEACVTGSDAPIAYPPRSERDLHLRYAAEYVVAWKAALVRGEAIHFKGMADAAAGLETLSRGNAPILGLPAMLVNNTSGFPPSEQSVAESISTAFRSERALFESRPGREHWVDSKNRAYIAALASLAQAVRQLAEGPRPDDAVAQLRRASELARGTVRQLGAGPELTNLLEAPIRATSN